MNLKARILEAARADAIPAGSDGLWHIKKWALSKQFFCVRQSDGKGTWIPAGNYTNLFRYTNATLHEQGELVMHDAPDEVKKHLQFALMARGRVLITGLGLGCVARMALANPQVESVTVIERDKSVLKLVAPFMPKERLTIVEGDALKLCRETRETYDCAWHDIWSDPDKEEPHLSILHSDLILSLCGSVKFQGAWELPRWYRRRISHVI